MPALSQPASDIWRDYATAGVPSSGAHRPRKSDIRDWGRVLESALVAGLGAAGSIAKSTLTELSGDLAHDADTLAWVYDDATAANNGVYRKSGASGAGAWTRISDLPYSVIPLTVSGGTANAVTAASILPVPTADRAAVLILTPTQTNTGPATLAINGTPALSLRSFDGTELAAGYLAAGVTVTAVLTAGTYRLLQDMRIPVLAATASAAAAAATSAATTAATAADAAAADVASIAGIAETALTARDDAVAAASVSGVVAIYQTYAEADAATGLSTGDVVEVMLDETRANNRTRYVVGSGGALNYVLSLPRLLVRTPVRGPSDVDDTESLHAAVTSAGVGGVIALVPGALYEVRARVTLLDYQTLDLNGATIRMCDQVQTTTTAAATSATTSFAVTDATGFSVGMSVALAKSGVARGALVYQTSLSTTDARITAISGNTITVSSGLNITGTFGVGSVLVNAFIPVLHATGTTLRNGKIDGNRANRPWARWEVDYLSEFPIGSVGSTVSEVVFQNAPGEGLGWFGDGHRCLNSRFVNIGGNGTHFSDAVQPLVESCWFENCNLDPDVGHSDGAICWSNGITHATILNNYITGSKSGIGSFDATNTDATIANNTITGNLVWGVYVASSAARLVLSNNRITNNNVDPSRVSGQGYGNTGGVFLNGVTGADYLIDGNQIDDPSAAYAFYAAGASSPTRLTVSANQIVGNVLTSAINNQNIAGNTVRGRVAVGPVSGLQFHGNTVDLAANTTDLAISLYGTGVYENCLFYGNAINGGAYGVNVGTAATALTAVTFKNNVLFNQSNRGVSITNTAATLNGVTVSENVIAAGPASLSSFSGIVANPAKITISGNDISETTGSAGTKIAINYTAASGAGAGGVIRGNVVRGSWNNAVALLPNAGAWCLDNVVDSGTVASATGNTIERTVTI